MRVAIAGAGATGRSIARALLESGHMVLLIEQQRSHYRPERVPDADWLLADACEVSTLQMAGIDMCDVVAAATREDQVNLVFSLLCKTEFAVPRVVARVSDPRNEWLFTESWGVDVAVSTPQGLVAAVEEAVSTGELVGLMTLHHGRGEIVEITLSARTALAIRRVGDIALPDGVALLTVRRGRELLNAHPDAVLRSGDELILIAAPGTRQQLRAAFR